MKLDILIAQINPTIGDLEGNLELAREAVKEGEKDDLVVFPELSVTGYPPKDLLDKPEFVEAAEDYARRWAALSDGGPAVLFGAVIRGAPPGGKGLQNVAHLAVDGGVVYTQAKTLLPSYDVFDEDRYFAPASKVQPMALGDVVIGVSICEDIWNDKEFWKDRRVYEKDPIEALLSQKNQDGSPVGIDVLINLSASPYSMFKHVEKVSMLSHAAAKFGKPLVYVNQVGGNDDVLYDGRSMVFDKLGTKIGHLTAFGPENRRVKITDETVCLQVGKANSPVGLVEVHDALVMGIRDYARKCGFKSAVVGLSGGIDSAVTCALAVEALGKDNVLGVSMPSRYSSEHSKSDALCLARNLGIKFEKLPIEFAFDAFLTTFENYVEDWPKEHDVTEENLQARIRGAILMAFSNKYGHLLLTTGNKSEVAVGYCTLYGDTCGGLAVLSDVLKTNVFGLARWINRDKEVIPENTISKPPSAELRPDQKDTDSLPDYPVLDHILAMYIEEQKGLAEIIAAMEADGIAGTIERVCRLVDRNEYKRKQLAPGLRVTKKAFGSGRVMPIAQKWR